MWVQAPPSILYIAGYSSGLTYKPHKLEIGSSNLPPATILLGCSLVAKIRALGAWEREFESHHSNHLWEVTQVWLKRLVLKTKRSLIAARGFKSLTSRHIRYKCMSGYVPECTIVLRCYRIRVIISDCLSEDRGSKPRSIAISIFVVFNAKRV